MEDVKRLFIEALLSKPPELLVSVWILDRIPLPFDSDIESYAKWRAKLANGFGVDPSSIVITGSSAFGISLNPYKNYRFFDSESDIDVAVVSEYYFNEAWRAFRRLGPTIHKLPPRAKQAVQNHVEKYIYWGTIATDQLLEVLPFSKAWNQALEELQATEPTHNRKIKARIYRDFDSLRVYQVNNLKTLRAKELEKGI